MLEAALGQSRVVVEAGGFLWVPRGTAHTFANAGTEAVHVLAMAMPGGIEELFAEQQAYLVAWTAPRIRPCSTRWVGVTALPRSDPPSPHATPRDRRPRRASTGDHQPAP